MSDAKHTPGPWTYKRDGDYWEIEPTQIGGKDNYEGNEADYNLIAAAPSMFEFVDLICHFTTPGKDSEDDAAITASNTRTSAASRPRALCQRILTP